jgi:DNA modification methylase
MSGGWGGRMLGAIISDVKSYTCTEPSIETAYGLKAIAKDFGGDTKIDVVIKGSEDYLPKKESLDLCFTSPPYFDLEKYEYDSYAQSYKKFPKLDLWVEGFLKKTFENCYYGLKEDGYMIINIADPKRMKKDQISIEQATIEKAEEVGFTHVETLKLALSNPNMKNRETAFKYEPIFVFKK